MAIQRSLTNMSICVFIRLGNTKAALHALQEAREAHTTSFEVFKELIQMEWIDDVDAARESLHTFPMKLTNCFVSSGNTSNRVQASPNIINQFSCRAYTLWGDRELSEGGHGTEVAKEKYERALSFVSSYGPAIAGLGQVKWMEGKVEEAKKILYEGALHDPTSPLCYKRLGILFAGEKNVPDARTAFKKGLDVDHFDCDIFLEWGKMEAAFGNFDVGRERLNIALHLDPKNHLVFDSLAKLEMKLGNRDEALMNFEQAAKLEPQNFKYWLSVGTLSLDVDSVKAKRVLDESLQYITKPVERAALLAVKGKAEALSGGVEGDKGAEITLREALKEDSE